MNHNLLTSLNNINLELKIRIGSKKISIKNLSKIKEGDVIILEKDEDDLVDILIGDEMVARGKIIEKDNEFFIEIRELKNSQEEY